MTRLDPQVRIVWILGGVVRAIFLTIISFVAEYFVVTQWDIIDTPYSLISIIIFVILFIWGIGMPILEYRFWLFDVRDNELYLERGVITKVKTTAPYVRIQHLDVQQGPFDRMFGLAKLVIYTAGTRGADIIVPGLPVNYAYVLRDQLKNFSPEDAV